MLLKFKFAKIVFFLTHWSRGSLYCKECMAARLYNDNIFPVIKSQTLSNFISQKQEKIR